MYKVYSGVVNTRVKACVRVEKNYFENSKNTVYSKNSSILGQAERIDNKEVSCTSSESYPTSCTATIDYSYAKVANAVNDIKTIVMENAGVGIIDKPILTSINSITDENNISVYPHPFTESFSVKFNNPVETASIMVFDLMGREVYRNEKVVSEEHISIKDLTPGIYGLHVFTNNHMFRYKIIKE